MNILVLCRYPYDYRDPYDAYKAFLNIKQNTFIHKINDTTANIINIIEKENINIIYMMKDIYGNMQVYNYCKKHNILIVFNYPDVYFMDEFKRGVGEYLTAKYADYIFTSQPGEVQPWREYTNNDNVYYLPMTILSTNRIMLPETNIKYDIGFPGNTYNKYRRMLIQRLRSSYKVKVISGLVGATFNNALSQCRTILAPAHDMPGRFSNRVYQMTGRGLYVIHQRDNYLEKEFTHETNIMMYNRDNAINEIGKYIEMSKDNKHRHYIKDNGFKLSENNTYEVHLQNMLNIIGYDNG